MTGVHDLHRLTIKEAVEATQVSESTIKRRIRAGTFPNAIQDDEGRWLIPLGDLASAGLRPGRMAKSDPVTPEPDRVHDLVVENAELRQRVAVAEALAAERNRIIDIQQQMLKMLEAGPSSTPEYATVTEVEQPGVDVKAEQAGKSRLSTRLTRRLWG